MSEAITVKIGGEERHLPDFRGFKATRATTLIARVSDEVQTLWDAMDTYQEEYKRTHTVRVTREEAAIRAASGAPGWGDIEFPDGQPYIEYPGLPSEGQRIMHVLKRALTMIESELLQMFALVLAPNKDLRDAMDDEARGGVDGYLTRHGQDLLHEANLGELLDLAIAAKKVILREFEGKEEALADLVGIEGWLPGREQETTEPAEEENPEPPSPSSILREAPPESGSASSLSLTPSDRHTDGQGEKSSGKSRGLNSVPSGTG